MGKEGACDSGLSPKERLGSEVSQMRHKASLTPYSGAGQGSATSTRVGREEDGRMGQERWGRWTCGRIGLRRELNQDPELRPRPSQPYMGCLELG